MANDPIDKPVSFPFADLASRFSELPDGTDVTSLSRDELRRWENRAVPSVDRVSDRSEADADERQDPTSSLNFPMHWTTARECWNYLFDFAVAGELLAPRPDDRVLDFASGTGWATEMLARLGVRVVSIDLSVEMMRRGRARIGADARLADRDAPAFVAARGQALPFADNSFDAVLCMNALHHLPSYGEALAEIHRVLKPGGRAVFSEPGTAHADAAHSQFRVREETVIEKSVALPAVRRLAFDAGFSRIRVVPLRSPDTYGFDYKADASDAAPLQQMWEDTLRHTTKEHARFVLHKGDDLPADTWLAPQQLTGRLQAHINVTHATDTARAGDAFTDRLRITNTGSVVWKAEGRRFGGQTTVGLKICDLGGNVLREDLGRTALSADVAPGQIVEIDMTVRGELPAGRYQLRYDMVVEGVTWFEFQGSPCPRRFLDVR